MTDTSDPASVGTLVGRLTGETGELAPSLPSRISARPGVTGDPTEWSSAVAIAFARGDQTALRGLAEPPPNLVGEGKVFGAIAMDGVLALLDRRWADARQFLRTIVGLLWAARPQVGSPSDDDLLGLVACLSVLARLAGSDPARSGDATATTAAAYANRSRQVHPSSALAHAVRSEVHLLAGEVGAAQRKAERAEQLDPESIDALIALARCAEVQGSPETAELYDRAAQLLLRSSDPLVELDCLARPAPTALMRSIAEASAQLRRWHDALAALDRLSASGVGREEWQIQAADARLRATCLRRVGEPNSVADALCDAADRLKLPRRLSCRGQCRGGSVGNRRTGTRTTWSDRSRPIFAT